MTNPSSWYKIAQFPGCGANDGLAPPAGYNRHAYTLSLSIDRVSASLRVG
jgi:hypothetical protein